MSVYSTDYFVNNISVLEEALDNELNNFNTMMESFNNNIEVVNEMKGSSRAEILIKKAIYGAIKLWKKFIQWFKGTLKDLYSNYKITTLKNLKKENSKKNEECKNAFALSIEKYSPLEASTTRYSRPSDSVENVQDFIDKNNDIISNAYNLINNLSNSTFDKEAINELIDMTIKRLPANEFRIYKKVAFGNTLYIIDVKDEIITMGDKYFDYFLKLDSQLDKLNELIKKYDNWIINTKENSFLTNEENKFGTIIQLLKQLSLSIFKLYKLCYSVTDYYYLCALGKKKMI